MAQIEPLDGIRYDFERLGRDVSSVIAPPYDVLNQADKDALLARSEHNIVAVDLPHIPPKEEGPRQAYQQANALLERWLAEGVLVREATPAIYAYNQTFVHDDQRYTRHQLIVRVRLCEFSEGVVLPHEQTFGGPKADRLALTKATRCNVSPVFGLYTDAENAVGGALESSVARESDATANVDDVDHKLWVVTDAAVIDRVRSVMADKRIYIADGHHRYGTALNYRSFVTEQSGGDLPDDHPAHFVMLVLASMDDPGCVILGYSRVLTEGVTLDSLLDAWKDGAVQCDETDADLVLYDGGSRSRAGVRFTDRGILEQLAPNRDPSWRELDVAYLHAYLIDQLLAKKLGVAPKIEYDKSQSNACERAEKSGGVAILPKATPMAQLRAVSEAAELMPQKSTYFFPKLATGLAINPLYDV